MGMFDSFYIIVDNKDIELQTKNFDRVLNVYEKGDIVAGSYADTKVFYTKITVPYKYPIEETDIVYTVYLVLKNHIFMEYYVDKEDSSDEYILNKILDLKKEWENKDIENILYMNLKNKEEKLTHMHDLIISIKNICTLKKKLEEDPSSVEGRFFYMDRDILTKLKEPDTKIEDLIMSKIQEYYSYKPNEAKPLKFKNQLEEFEL